MKIKYLNFVLLALITTTICQAKTPEINIDEGKNLFSSQCASCHNVNVKLVGPALANVDQRHNLEWIIKFVQSSQNMVKGNDKEAVALFSQFNQTVMPDHLDISGTQINSILGYIKSQSKAITNTEAPPFATPHMFPPNNAPVLITNVGFFGTYLGVILFVVACLVFAVKVKEIQREK